MTRGQLQPPKWPTGAWLVLAVVLGAVFAVGCCGLAVVMAR